MGWDMDGMGQRSIDTLWDCGDCGDWGFGRDKSRFSYRCEISSSYKPAHLRLWDLGGDWGVYWGTCKEKAVSGHNGHSQKRAVNCSV